MDKLTVEREQHYCDKVRDLRADVAWYKFYGYVGWFVALIVAYLVFFYV